MPPLRLMAILAHPDDESLGFGGALARYASEGIETSLVCATLGQRGRMRGKPPGDPEHPGPDRMAEIREAELRNAAKELGIQDVSLLGYMDGAVDQVDPRAAHVAIATQVRRVRPHVAMSFGPEGAYGHPDHIAVSQFALAALVLAADPSFETPDHLAPHAVSKFYYQVSTVASWQAYQDAFKRLVSMVDGVERMAVAWPDWQVTTVIDTAAQWETVWRAVSCHDSQVGAYDKLKTLSPEQHSALWGRQHYYRVFSTVNGGRAIESDLFEGLRGERPTPRNFQEVVR